MRTVRAAFRFGGLLWIALVACVAAPGPMTPHADQSRRLPQIMREFDALSHERLPQAMDLEQERIRRLYKVSRVAAAMAESATQLDAGSFDTSLSAEETRIFATYADLLQRRTRTLARNAHRLSPEGIQAQAALIEDTCVSCHQRLRPGWAPRESGRE